MNQVITVAAVEAAVAEYDRIGQPAFLAKYGSGPALEYFLIIGGKEYDSKAIVRAASVKLNGGKRMRMTGGKNGAAAVLEALDFEVAYRPRGTKRDVKWTWDEHVLALELYFESFPSLPSPKAKEIRKLSRELNRLGELNAVVRTEKYRNPEGVSMKLGNFRRHDSRHTEQTYDDGKGNQVKKVGISRGAEGEGEVWSRYLNDEAGLRVAAALVRALMREAKAGVAVPLLDPYEDAGKPEGAIKLRLHKIRERAPSLVKDKLTQVLAKEGKLECEVCTFNFADRFGPHGAGFLEVHHKKPISLSEIGRITTLDELAVVCANCHRMLHTNGLIEVDHLREILAAHS